MNVPQLVGAVAASLLRDHLSVDASALPQGTARFALNLNADQTAAVASAVLSEPSLRSQIDIKLPVSYVGQHGLPADVLTDLPATYFRNASCSKAAFLLADVEHDEQASFNEIARIGPSELLDRIDLWVEIAGAGLNLHESHFKWWERALTGLRDLRVVSLDRFATYVLQTRQAVAADGQPLLLALGVALPALRLPRDTCYFNAIKEKSRLAPSAWRTQFSSAQRRRASLLLKQTSTQLLLTEDDLQAAFDKVRSTIPETYHPAIVAFIAAPGGWNDAAANLAQCEWEAIRPLFDGLQRERFDLGRETLAFYSEREADLLDDDEREYLTSLVGRKTTESDDGEDLAFYEAHRHELKDDKKLKSAWDRFVFGKPVEATDFLAGLAACLQPLFNRAPSGMTRSLRIRCERATRRDLRDLNVEAGFYFAHRYAGLPRCLGEFITWDVGELFEFPALVERWRQSSRTTLNRSTARPALQLKFILELETKSAEGDLHLCSAQLIWRFELKSVISQLVDDWGRLTKHPLTYCGTMREAARDGVSPRYIDLSDVRSFHPAHDRDRGTFVPAYKPQRDIAKQWLASLDASLQKSFLSGPTAQTLRQAFAQFETSYTQAITEFASQGSSNPINLTQLEDYGALLDAVVTLAKGDRNRDLLLRPLLLIGVVPVTGDSPASIIAPWHPMRLAAMWRKSHLVSALIQRLMRTEEVGDTQLFFTDLRHDLAHPLYPELTVGWTDSGCSLLAMTDVFHDYSLHEPPVVAPETTDRTSDSPKEGSECVVDLVRRYLALHPHERANMSVVLFNCDSARLPEAVVDRIGSIQDDDEDVRCQVLLRHIDSQRLRDVYRSILGADSSADAYSPSEATQDFMARLRISVIADQAPPPDPKDGCPYDIVFSQDVVARHARVEWYPERSDPADFATLLPSRWSRRRPAAADDLKSAVFLCCPVQSNIGWAYLTAIATFFRGDWDGDTNRRLLPVRQLDFRDGRTARIFQETHDLANWVVNFDELLDRRQLLNQQVRVIRYKQSATQGRNTIISSRAPLSLLRAMILHRLRDLALGLTDAQLAELADKLIEDANDVSGDIVLRAAKRGRSASELVGVVLSRQLLRDELPVGASIGWYFLDDYAAWMGQREEQLADLLALSPEPDANGLLKLTIAVSEAKYVDIASLAAKRRESHKQLRDTVRRIEEALAIDSERLDRESWLARLSDLVLDGIRLPAASAIDLGQWRRAIREGRCKIDLLARSHIFVPSTIDAAEPTAIVPLGDVNNGYQEIYGRAALKAILLAYWRGESTLAARIAAGADHLPTPPKKPSGGASPSAPTTPPPPPNAPQGATAMPPASPPAGNSDIDQPSAAWAYPAIGELLKQKKGAVDETDDQAWLTRTATKTKAALQQLQFQAKIVQSALTPNSALVKFAGSAQLTVDQIIRRRSELLTTFGLNVISVRPEPGAITLAIERPQRRLVDVGQLWSTWNPSCEGWGNQDLLIGIREYDGTPLLLSPGRLHAPHTLIAGSTGSGKSVLLQNILLAIAATNSPQQARIMLIDPKQGVDFFAFDGLAHLDGKVIDDQEQAAARLGELVIEMDRRYSRFKESRVPNLASYNAKVPVSERLPTIWLIHDEFAEWMLIDEYKQAVATTVQRLGVKARAAGIHLIFAAQRPDANVMPMQLRANLGNRLILRVDSEGTSEIALGEKGAERLLGKGHLLAKLEGERDLCYAQVPYVPDTFIEAIVGVTR